MDNPRPHTYIQLERFNCKFKNAFHLCFMNAVFGNVQRDICNYNNKDKLQYTLVVVVTWRHYTNCVFYKDKCMYTFWNWIEILFYSMWFAEPTPKSLPYLQKTTSQPTNNVTTQTEPNRKTPTDEPANRHYVTYAVAAGVCLGVVILSLFIILHVKKKKSTASISSHGKSNKYTCPLID